MCISKIVILTRNMSFRRQILNKIDTIDYTISKDDNSLEYKAMYMEVFANLESVLEQQGLTVEFEEKPTMERLNFMPVRNKNNSIYVICQFY